ncbi:MAG: zinc ribbon domain-containing protein [Chloroflexi bacterium]|nr:zinc ribbon domain-containing protein [Chloroflexota bacterium]
MNQRIYHGNITTIDFANALAAHYNRGNWRVQQIGDRSRLVVQIATRDHLRSGGQTAVSVILTQAEDGVVVQIGQQAWIGVAASLGFSALSALRNPLNLLNRLDDIAQDIESLQLSEDIVRVLENTARALGASTELSERLRRVTCAYCGTANPVGEPRCIACGAPLGAEQPNTCKYCGFVLRSDEKVCPNCGRRT